MQFYPDAWWLVDYGATYGCTPSYYGATSDYIAYHYRDGSHMAQYYDLMMRVGFIYDEAYSERLTSTFNVPLYFYHPKYQYSFVADIDRKTRNIHPPTRDLVNQKHG